MSPHLARALRTAAIAMIVAACAILLFGSNDDEGLMADGRFWGIVAASGVGALIGSLIFRKRKQDRD